MTDKLDLIVLPFHRVSGTAQPSLPGLYASAAPRGAARGRHDDRLIASLFMAGTATFPPEGQHQLLEGIAKTYFHTPGAVTSALRAGIESFNQFLLERNLRTSAQGIQATGLLTLFAAHGDQLYLAQCGDTHLFLVSRTESILLHDPIVSGRGLGLGRTPVARYAHIPLEAGSLVILTPDSPGKLTPEALKPAFGRKLSGIQHALARSVDEDWQAVVLQVVTGRDKVRILTGDAVPERAAPVIPTTTPPSPSPASPPVPVESAAPLPSKPPLAAPEPAAPPVEARAVRSSEPALPVPEPGLEPEPVAEPEPETELESEPELETEIEPGPEPDLDSELLSNEPIDEEPLVPSPSLAYPAVLASAPIPQPASSSASAPLPVRGATPATREPVAKPVLPPREQPSAQEKTALPGAAAPKSTPRRPRRQPILGPALLAIGQAFGYAGKQLQHLLRGMLTRLLPGNEMFTIPAATMAFIAIAVPVIIVTAASFVYLRRGRSEQFQDYFLQAQAAAVMASGAPSSQEKRQAWDAVLFFLDEAEEYQVTEETELLRQQAYQVLDQMDTTTRLEFRPAVEGGNLGEVQITRIAQVSDALYLLDSVAGRVLRLWLTGRGYEYDPSFQCSPGQYGSYIVEALVDMVPLPSSNSFGAAILAMDANGILVYCVPDQALLAQPLVPPDSNWGQPVSMDYSGGRLYVLDPKTNAVWVYEGQDFTFGDRPRLFFDQEIPSMNGVVDFVVTGSTLFLLHDDSRITTCEYRSTFGDVTIPTSCKTPTLYSDSRESRGDVPTLAGAQMAQILYNPPPGPSFYLLDPANQAIYHTSLRLTFQQQYRPTDTSLGPITAIAIGRSRELFAAFGSRLMVASLP